MKILKINHAAVWVASLVVQFVPPVWYDTVFFGIRWAELNGLSEADFAQYNMAAGLISNLVCCVAAAYTMAFLFVRLKVDTGLKGLQYALLIWVGFIFLEMTTQNMFSLRSFELTVIDQSVVLIKYEIVGIILGLWKKYKTVGTANFSEGLPTETIIVNN
ncbi:DUF1761 domain-containing protein [Fulvivirga sp. M361]|uniref:DUF1761 domain-containing protein n=1 Tax=Fulvivirga sp. M361 TaxID=2594266 RepID=UPI00117B36A4|nr:DUF1761 domain-containing protein [Fulvivirga sp. M361]TRX58632.1 DUF1761 domain-containing protein [Fulvivirga sp. M361]